MSMLNELDAVTFENRNKEYGAYRIRKAYTRLLANALLLVCTISVALFLLVFSYYYFKDDSYISAGELMVNFEATNLDIHELSAPPEIPSQPLSEETILPKVEVLKQPIVSTDQTTPLPEDKKKEEIIDSLNKRGETLVIKNDQGDGSDTGAIYIRVERYPEFPGGRPALDKYLRDNIKYANNPATKKIGGLVHVSFMVTSIGRVEKVRVTRSLNPIYDTLAVRAVRAMPFWTPGRRLGKPVNVLLTLPVRFVASG